MIGSISIQVALLAFAAAIVAGLYAQNSAAVVLQRALVALLVGLVVGKIVAWSTKLVLRDHLQRRKYGIDQENEQAAEKAAKDQSSGQEAKSEPNVQTG